MRQEIVEIDPCLIFERGKPRIVEDRDKHVIDKITHRLATAAMSEGYRLDTDGAKPTWSACLIYCV